MLVPPMEPRIMANNQPSMIVNNGVIRASQSLKTLSMQELIAVTTLYSTGPNSSPKRVIKTGIDGSTPDASGSGTNDVDICPIPTPPSVCIWDVSVVNKGQNTTPNFRETSELLIYIDRRLSNDSDVPSVGSQIIRDKLSISSGRDNYSQCSMDVAAETIQPMGPQLVTHGLLTIDTLKKFLISVSPLPVP